MIDSVKVQKLATLSNVDDCPGQGFFDFNQLNKNISRNIVISNYRNNMNCWWFVSNSMNTGHMELTFPNYNVSSICNIKVVNEYVFNSYLFFLIHGITE